MTTKGLDVFLNQNPFRPFCIHVSSGEKFQVYDARSIMVMPDMTAVYTKSEKDEPMFLLIDNYQITHASVVGPTQAKS